ncbi:uncharacterized protein METZ01_LOCUS428218 [marine metagenome]|uniref:YdbS-like PH domain-containing protein n=1 Tax=marine metagenome TaxID=408172 RepID=A0A382XWU4_9ZZZZ
MDTSLRPDKLYLKKYVYFILLVTVIIYIFFVPFCLIIFKEGGPGLFILFLGTVGWLALGAIILLFSKLWIDRLSYIIKDSSITIYKGIFTKIEQNIPNTKVTDFILHRDLFDRFMGIGSIQVQTAGASGAVGYEGKLDGVLDYEEVHRNLRDKLISMQTVAESTKNTNESNDSVLTDILVELREINKKLNS